ncbi:cell envelope biogenesis protein TolA [Xanthobacter sp. AM11]|uniref:cell envelope biogenesis protein TolA n=1 Tax=Xanthobacter sp. AM11 TaxID=3380643 RepID=UPI0039BF2292
MRGGLVASTALHAGVIVLTLVSFSGAKPFEPMPESLPVDVVSFSEFTKITKGTKSAPKADVPKQVAEKVDPVPTPPDDPKVKVSEKPPVEATAPPPPPPPPPPKVDQPAPPKAADAPPPKEQAEVALKSEPKKEDPPKQEPKQEAAAMPVPPRKPSIPREPAKPSDAPDRPNPLDEAAKLLDKRTPQRQAAGGPQVSDTGSLGTQSGTSATLSASVIDALKRKIDSCWSPPAIPFDQNVRVKVNFELRRDGTLVATPRLIATDPAGSAYGQAYAESGIRAIGMCGPYSFLPQAQYDLWKNINFTFNSDDARQLSVHR